jgi:hypothetical protein
MTTIKDYAHDLVLETIKLSLRKTNPEIDFDEKLDFEIQEMIDEKFTKHEIEDLVDDFIETIKNRILE